MNSAIITGASRGIGAATAKLLAHKGYAVCINYRENREEAERVAEYVRKAGGKACTIQANMGIESDVLQIFECAEQELGPVKLLVNNAAINPKRGSGAVEEMIWQDIEQTFHVNVVGVFIACREAIRRMKAIGGGAIINVSSEAGKFGGNRMAHYAASKAAINTFTIALAREVAPYNIRVNAVSPGVIDTGAHKDATPERLTALHASLPMGRMGTAEEVAHTIAWLLSEEASYVSGAILPVAGAR